MFHLHWGEKISENVSINISWCKIPNSTFQALRTSKIEDWILGMCSKKCFLSYVAGEGTVMGSSSGKRGWLLLKCPWWRWGVQWRVQEWAEQGSKPCAWEAWVGGDADQNAVLVVFHRQGAGAQDHGWDPGCLSGGIFLKAERNQMLWGKQNVQSPPHPIDWTHLPHTWDADRNGWEPASIFRKIFFIS